MKQSVIEQYKGQAPARVLLQWMEFPPSSWYYRPGQGKRGARPSTATRLKNGGTVSNHAVVDEIKKVLTGGLEFYGYEKVCWELHERGYIINKKKVYRLMKQENLLITGARVHTTGERQFVKFRKIDAQRPLQYLVMDIKQVYIHGEDRFAYLLTVMDVCSRFALAHTLKYSVRKNDVILLLDGILQGIKPEGMVMRNDNGSQFIAHKVRKYLKRNNIAQEFTHIATPEENGHIESFHSSISRENINRNCFDSLHHARMVIGGYYRVYNYSRKHRSLKRKSPYQYIKTFFPEFSDKHPFAFSVALSRVPLASGQAGAGTCLALDKEKQENAIFVQSENQENRKCLLN